MANKPGEANFFPAVPVYPEMGTFQPVYGKFDLTTYIQGASDYEIMAFLVGKYNACLEAYGNITKLSTDTITACKQLQDWINSWFTNLDVQEEINKKIDSMVADGSFGTLLHQTFDAQINQQTTNAVTQWLVANVTPTGSAVVVDKSLSIEGAAADAKEVGSKWLSGLGTLFYDDASAGDYIDLNKLPGNSVAEYVNVNAVNAPITPFSGIVLTLNFAHTTAFSNGVQIAYTFAGDTYTRGATTHGFNPWVNQINALNEKTDNIDNKYKNTIIGLGTLFYDDASAGDYIDLNKLPGNSVAEYVNVNAVNAPITPFSGIVLTLNFAHTTAFSNGVQIAYTFAGDTYTRGATTHGFNPWVNQINEPISKTFVVGKNSNYTTLTSALHEASLLDDNIIKNIIIQEGTYDIYAEMGGDNYFNALDPTGKSFTDVCYFVTNANIYGIGEVNITMDMSNVTNQNTRWLFSPINVKGNFTLNNITINATNCRYAIHDESGNKYPNTSHIYNNVYAKTNIHSAVGCGYSQNSSIEINNCTFISNDSAYSYHSKGHILFKATNSSFITATSNAIRFSQESNTNDAVYINNCYISGTNKILLRREFDYSADEYVNCTKLTTYNTNIDAVTSNYSKNKATGVGYNTIDGTETVFYN